MDFLIPAAIGFVVCCGGFAWALVRGGDLEPPTPPERDGESVRWAP